MLLIFTSISDYQKYLETFVCPVMVKWSSWEYFLGKPPRKFSHKLAFCHMIFLPYHIYSKETQGKTSSASSSSLTSRTTCLNNQQDSWRQVLVDILNICLDSEVWSSFLHITNNFQVRINIPRIFLQRFDGSIPISNDSSHYPERIQIAFNSSFYGPHLLAN